MASVCDGSAAIRTCAPHANVHDVTQLLQEFCKECYGEVITGTDTTDFCADAFGGSVDTNCDFLIVKRGTEPDAQYFISTDCTNWHQISWEDHVGNVPIGTLPENFLVTAWGTYAAMPDEDTAPIIFVIEGGCDIWIAVNDRAGCDLGTIPPTPATGTAWVKIEGSNLFHTLKISGLEVDVDNGLVTATIYPGRCRDDTDVVDMRTSGNINIDCSGNGANGLDANDGALAINTWYYVYIISGVAGTAGFMSTSGSPTLPVGYAYKRRVGWAKTNNPAIFIGTEMRDNVVTYNSYVAILTNVDVATWPAYSAASFAVYAPPTCRHVASTHRISTGAADYIYYSKDGVNLLVYFITGGNPSYGWHPISDTQVGYYSGSAALVDNLTVNMYAYLDDRMDVT